MYIHIYVIEEWNKIPIGPNQKLCKNILHMAHCMNLVVQTSTSLNLVSNIESLLQSMYNYFSRNPKQHLQTTKLIELH
jgi:hypothetical protein